MGWGPVIFSELMGAVLALGIEQLLQSRYGGPGLLGLFFLVVGIKARNVTCASAGAVIFVLLMAQA